MAIMNNGRIYVTICVCFEFNSQYVYMLNLYESRLKLENDKKLGSHTVNFNSD